MNKKIVAIMLIGVMVFSGLFVIAENSNSVSSHSSVILPYSSSVVKTYTFDLSNSVAGKGNYTLPISISSSYYSAYSTNLENVEFTYSNGSIIYSWLYTYDSSNAYWFLNIYNSTTSFDMNIGTSSTVYMNNLSVGENPCLSSTYGKYDNGRFVFPVYINAYTSLSKFVKLESGYSVSNNSNSIIFSGTGTRGLDVYYNKNITLSNFLTSYKVVDISGSTAAEGMMMGNNTNSTGGAISVDGADTLGQFFTNESQDDGYANYVSYTPSTPFYVNNTFDFSNKYFNSIFGKTTTSSSGTTYFTNLFSGIKKMHLEFASASLSVSAYYGLAYEYGYYNFSFPTITNSIKNVGGFTEYTLNTNYENYTLPYYNPYQQGYNDYGRNMTNTPILAEISGIYGFVYQTTSNYLGFYEIQNHKMVNLTTKWQNYTIPNTYGGKTYTYWASRQNIFYTQLSNGNLSEITNYGLINGYIYVQMYNVNTNTYISKNSTLPISDVQVGSWTTTYLYEISPFTISNGTFLFIFSTSSDATDIPVSSGDYIWNINSGKFYAYNIAGVGTSDATANTAMIIYSFSAVSNTDGGTLSLYQYSFSTNSFTDYSWVFDSGGGTNNNDPIFIENAFNGTYLISFYQNTVNGGTTYGSYYTYFNPSTHTFSGETVVSSTDTVNNVETMANQEIYMFKNLVSGVNGLTPYLSGYTDAYGLFFDYVNNSLLSSNLSWINNENNKNDNPTTNVLIAETNNSIFYTFNAENNSVISKNTIFTVYWSPEISNGIVNYQSTVHYKLSIIENGLSLGTTWSFNFNGSQYTLTNNSYSFELLNGLYLLSVNLVKGFTSNYQSEISISNSNYIAYVNFTPIYYHVFFKIYGLPLNTSWAVIINGSQYISNNGVIEVNLTDGIYNPIFVIPNGYTENDIGMFSVNGNTSYFIQLSQSPFLFLQNNLAYIIVFLFIMMILILAIAVRGRRE